LVVVLSLVAFAATPAVAAESVEVTTVRFATARAPNGAPNPWFEAEVVLAVSPPAEGSGRFVSRVRVGLMLGWELPAAPGGSRRTDFYRGEAECVALEAGRASVRFYLPPELVKRDHLRGPPKLWHVTLLAGGRFRRVVRRAWRLSPNPPRCGRSRSPSRRARRPTPACCCRSI